MPDNAYMAEYMRKVRAGYVSRPKRYEQALTEIRAIAATATGPKGQRIVAVVDAALGGKT